MKVKCDVMGRKCSYLTANKEYDVVNIALMHSNKVRCVEIIDDLEDNILVCLIEKCTHTASKWYIVEEEVNNEN